MKGARGALRFPGPVWYDGNMETAVWSWVAPAVTAPALRFPFLERLGGVVALFTTRHGGNCSHSIGDDPAAVAANRRRLLALAGAPPAAALLAGLVHGAGVARVTAPAPGTGPAAPAGDAVGLVPATDALVTDTPGLALLVTTADCTPVYVYDPIRRAAGLAHAGWRGTAAGIAARTVAAMVREFGSDPARLYAVVGPAIGPCCYEVDEPVVAACRMAPAFGASWLQPGQRPGRWQLDLWAANREQLQAAGIPPAQVAVAGLCTSCRVQEFFSHRAEAGRAGRQAAILRLRPEAGHP